MTTIERMSRVRLKKPHGAKEPNAVCCFVHDTPHCRTRHSARWAVAEQSLREKRALASSVLAMDSLDRNADDAT